MVRITAADIKKLREMTGAGMMDCKKALSESAGGMDAAVDILRKKGLAAASRKAGRVAAEGIVLAISRGDAGAVLEVNSETDFVSKNKEFTEFVHKLADLVIRENPVDVEALNALRLDDEHTVAQALSQLIAATGENMNIRRFERLRVDGGVVAAYVHGAGKIGVLASVRGEPDDALRTLARNVAMHVAATSPQYIRRDDVPAEAVERERRVLSERAAASGKPEHIIDRIVSGQLGKFYSETCLLEQAFVMDADQTVAMAVAAVQPDADVVAMSRFQLGEGIEKKKNDFVAEVAAQVNG